MMIKGIDVSNYNGNLTNYWDAIIAAGVRFAYSKVSDGLAYGTPYDTGRKYYLPEFAKRGVMIGAYHYFRNDVNAEYQAGIMLKGCEGVTLNLPPALDVERANNPTLDGWKIHNCLLAIERLFGRKPIIYTSASVWDSIGDTWAADYDLWVASYRPDAPYLPEVWKQKGYKVWQYSQTETINGKPFDHNSFNGTEAEFVEFCNGATSGNIPPPVPDEPKVRVIADFLRLRYKPSLYSGTTLIVEKWQVLRKAGEVVTAEGINWQPVKFPAEYGEGLGYISANPKYIEQVR